MSDGRRPATPFHRSAIRFARPLRAIALCLGTLAVAACEGLPLPAWLQTGTSESTIPETTAPSSPQSRATPDKSVAEAQRMLSRLGYRPGPDDGLLGQRTRAAVRQYREENRLPASDGVDEHLLGHLRDAVRRDEERRTVSYDSAERPPVAETGDIYVYSDGSVETVQRAAGDRVWWETSAGQVDVAYANFLLPRWQRGRRGTEPPRLNADPATLWPGPRRGAVSFDVEFQDPDLVDSAEAARIVQHWKCAVLGMARVEVPAGQFDTIIIACERNPVIEGQWQTRVWHYSPALGHYVRRQDRFADGRRTPRTELVAVRPGGAEWPPAARAGLDWALSTALDKGPTGEPLTWSSSAVADSFVIRVTAERKSDLVQGSDCRTFVEERQPKARQRVFAGLACRNPITQRWAIPFLAAPAAGFTPPGQ